jgi:hypothetical protein
MTSSDAASWVQGIGTLLAVIVTGLTVLWQGRQQERQRMAGIARTEEVQAQLIQAWIGNRQRATYGGLHNTDVFTLVEVRIQNLADLIARDVRLCLELSTTTDTVSAWRSIDIVSPSQPEVCVRWLFDLANPAATDDTLVVVSQYTIAGQCWEQRNDNVRRIVATKFPRWQKVLSQSAKLPDDAPETKRRELLLSALFAAIDEACAAPPGAVTQDYINRLTNLPISDEFRTQLIEEISQLSDHMWDTATSPQAKEMRIEKLLTEFSRQTGTHD